MTPDDRPGLSDADREDRAESAAKEDMRERLAERCPEHGISDCSPLLNGCSRLQEQDRLQPVNWRRRFIESEQNAMRLLSENSQLREQLAGARNALAACREVRSGEAS